MISPICGNDGSLVSEHTDTKASRTMYAWTGVAYISAVSDLAFTERPLAIIATTSRTFSMGIAFRMIK